MAELNKMSLDDLVFEAFGSREVSPEVREIYKANALLKRAIKEKYYE